MKRRAQKSLEQEDEENDVTFDAKRALEEQAEPEFDYEMEPVVISTEALDYDSDGGSESEGDEEELDEGLTMEEADRRTRESNGMYNEEEIERKRTMEPPPYLMQFARPDLPEELDEGACDLMLQNVDISYDVVPFDERFADMRLHPQQDRNAVLTVYGLVKPKREGDEKVVAENSACMHIHGFNPFLYLEVTDDAYAEDIKRTKYWGKQGPRKLEEVRVQLNSLLGKPGTAPEVLKVEVEMKKSIKGFRRDTKPFFKVYLADPRNVSRLRDMIEPHNKYEKSAFALSNKTYESNIPYVTRYMVDEGMCGGGWSEIAQGAYHVRHGDLQSFTQLEFDVQAKHVKNFSGDERPEMGRMRGLFFDIEVSPETPGTFPTSSRVGDRVTSIGVRLTNLDNNEVVKDFVLALGETDPIKQDEAKKKKARNKPVDVLVCRSEGDLLLWFASLVRIFDPDVILGYNSINFDMQYLFDRAEFLAVREKVKGLGFLFEEMSRRRNYGCKIKHEKFESGALGKLNYYLARMPGRLQYDVMLLARRDVTMRPHGYQLKQIAEYVLKNTNKDIMTYTAIPCMMNGCFTRQIKHTETTREWMAVLEHMEPVLIDDPQHAALIERVVDEAPNESVDVRMSHKVDEAERRQRELDGDPMTEAELKQQAERERESIPRTTNFYWRTRPETLKNFKPDAKFDKGVAEAIRSGGQWHLDWSQHTMGMTWTLITEFNLPITRFAKTGGEVQWRWTKRGREVVHRYCMQDSIVTEEVNTTKMFYMNHIELARLCYIPMMSLITQGQQIRIISGLLRYNRGTEFVLPYYRPPELTADEKRERKTKFQGATVLDPFVRFLVGAEDGMISVLDFAGLYPSIMMDNNLCYSTFVYPEDVQRLQDEGVKMHQAPNGAWFVDRDVFDGILPRFLRRLTAARKSAKGDMAAAQQMVKEFNAAKEAFLKAPMGFFTGWADPFTKDEGLAGRFDADDGWRDLAGTFLEQVLESGGEAVVEKLRDAYNGRVPWGARTHNLKKATADYMQKIDVLWTKDILEFCKNCVRLDGSIDAMFSYAVQQYEIEIEKAAMSAGAFDSKQLAIKVVCNSVYGSTGAELGRLPLMELSGAVTAYGRFMIESVKEMCERRNPETGNYMCDPNAALNLTERELEQEVLQLQQRQSELDDEESEAFEKKKMKLEEAKARVKKQKDGLSKWPVRVVYGDTDSVFPWIIGCCDVQTAWDIGQEMGEMATRFFARHTGLADTKIKAYIQLDLEKVVDEYNMFSKKRYVTRQWEMNAAGEFYCKIMKRGFEEVRRDFAELVRDILSSVRSKTMPARPEDVLDKEQLKTRKRKVRDGELTEDMPEFNEWRAMSDVKGAIHSVHDALRKMNRQEVPISKFIITKGVRGEESDYADGRLPAFMVLRQKLRARGIIIESGQRIPHVYVHNPQGKDKLVDKCEDPDHAVRNNLQIDTKFYIERQLLKPLCRFFANILYREETGPMKNFSLEEIDRMLDATREDDPKIKAAKNAETARRRKAAKTRLFDGPHMRSIVQTIPVNSQFRHFTRWMLLSQDLQAKGIGVEQFAQHYKLDLDNFKQWLAGKRMDAQIDQVADCHLTEKPYRVPKRKAAATQSAPDSAPETKSKQLKQKDMRSFFGKN